MRLSLKILLIAVIVFNVASLIWFLLGTTANFQRSLDLVSTVIFVQIWAPSLVLTIFSILLLVKGWNPSSGTTYAKFFVVVIILLFFSVVLFQNVHTEGWLTEIVRSDSLKITSDENYEYRLDLINLFQRNSRARLFLRNISTDEEINIPISIHTNKIRSISSGDVNWVTLEPSNESEHYILYTTKKLRIPIEKFEIDVIKGTSRRLE